MSKKKFLMYWLIIYAISILEHLIKGDENLYMLIIENLITSFLAVQFVRLINYTFNKIKNL
jgi:hypothetical protein